MEFQRLPICVFSFNRVEYLRATLDSLRHAIGVGGMVGPVVLFQDGLHNVFSRQDKTTPEVIEACKQVFLDLTPHGVVFEAEQNLGIARNIYRGEMWAFDTMRYPAALFFEDDMVVSPRYFRVMAKLFALALAQPRIAMFSAYGSDGLASVARQFEHRAHVGPMHHNWAFGLTRDGWLRRETLTREYMALLAACDYRDRPHDRIAGWYARLGWPPLPTSQDIAKSVALNTLGLARIASVAICARNIGEIGQHYTPDEFRRMKFADVAMLESEHPDAEWEFDRVSEDAVDAIVTEQRREAQRVRLNRDAFLGSNALLDALRVAHSIGGEALLRPGAGRCISSVSGLYPDRWCYPSATVAFAAAVALRGVEVEAIAAQHLPPGATLTFTLNGRPALTVPLEAGRDVSAVVPMPRHLDGLEKLLTMQCSVVVDPYSLGFNQDRRALSVLLLRLTLLERDGTQTVIPGEHLVRGGAA
jgi:hypothetical protein